MRKKRNEFGIRYLHLRRPGTDSYLPIKLPFTINNLLDWSDAIEYVDRNFPGWDISVPDSPIAFEKRCKKNGLG
jgi:hypothetical protein